MEQRRKSFPLELKEKQKEGDRIQKNSEIARRVCFIFKSKERKI